MSLLITKRQLQIYEFIVEHIEAKGFPPTCQEIADEFKFKSPNSVTCHLKYLMNKGYIKLSANKARGITLTKANMQSHYELKFPVRDDGVVLTTIEFNNEMFKDMSREKKTAAALHLMDLAKMLVEYM